MGLETAVALALPVSISAALFLGRLKKKKKNDRSSIYDQVVQDRLKVDFNVICIFIEIRIWARTLNSIYWARK